ncbi:uridylate kinase [Xylaria nigripes]|nr:uridylate kinase [Xylaria nigripes]
MPRLSAATLSNNIGSAASRRTYSSRPPRGANTTVKFWPFLLITAMSFGAFAYMSKSRAGQGERERKEKKKKKKKMPAIDDLKNRQIPVFSADDVTVLFVLGGPGAGKGTQCERLVATYGFTHLSAGDLLRAEQDRPGSQYGELIKNYIKNGLIVPMEVTIALLENAMRDAMSKTSTDAPTTDNDKEEKPAFNGNGNGHGHGNGNGDIHSHGNGNSHAVEKKQPALKGKFLIDGFPRKFDQAIKFEEAVCPAKFVLFYDCPEEEMERRLLERGKTSGRADDNAESIRKRFRTFIDTSMPVVHYFEKQGRVAHIRANVPPDEVYRATQAELAARLGENF